MVIWLPTFQNNSHVFSTLLTASILPLVFGILYWQLIVFQEIYFAADGVGLDNMIRNIILISIILSKMLLVGMGFEYQKPQFVSFNNYDCYHKHQYHYLEDMHRSGDGLGRPPFEQRLLQSWVSVRTRGFDHQQVVMGQIAVFRSLMLEWFITIKRKIVGSNCKEQSFKLYISTIIWYIFIYEHIWLLNRTTSNLVMWLCKLQLAVQA